MNKLAGKLIFRNMRSVLLLIALLAAGNASAEASLDTSSSVCKAVKNEKAPSAFLLDEHGVISKGPIDFGRYPYQYSHQDFYTIWTNYKLIVTPARIKLESCPNGCLELKKIKSMCPMSSTYQVGFSSLDKPSNVSDKSWLPWNVDVTSGFLNVEDPQSLYPIELKYNFDRRIRGEVYDAGK